MKIKKYVNVYGTDDCFILSTIHDSLVAAIACCADIEKVRIAEIEFDTEQFKSVSEAEKKNSASLRKQYLLNKKKEIDKELEELTCI